MNYRPPPDHETAPRRRDRAQGRVRRTTRWVAALAVGGVAVVVGVAAHEVPAKSSTASNATGTSPGVSNGSTSQGSSGSSSTATGVGGGGLSSPSASPSASSGGGIASTGGS